MVLGEGGSVTFSRINCWCILSGDQSGFALWISRMGLMASCGTEGRHGGTSTSGISALQQGF